MTIATALLLVVAVVPLARATDQASLKGTGVLLRQLGTDATIAYHGETGLVRFIGAPPGQPIAPPDGSRTSDSPVATSRVFLDSLGPHFGIADQATELKVTSSAPASAGRSAVRFQQFRDRLPVLGGELVVNLDADGNLLSIGGEALPAAADVATTATVSASAAGATARSAVAKDHGVPRRLLESTTPHLWIYDSRILGGPGPGIPRLVWRTDVTDGQRRTIDELVLVDARLGSVALSFTQIEQAATRSVCDANNTATEVPCTSPVRSEGEAPGATQDVNDGYDYLGDTYDFYLDTLGRDSLDGAGMPLIATVRYCPSGSPCPYANAYWSRANQQMVFGEGWAAADDVVSHELTHGVTQFTSRLFYYYQSGAINESMSDVFGEFVDLTNGAGTDTAGTRWQVGEDVLGVGPFRDMEDPTVFSDPDRMTSPFYAGDQSDSGGVHTNSGVSNKAAFLMTDGATFNGQTVTGLGITKAANIYYEAEANLLTSASDYADLADALPQACANLVGTVGIAAADCTEVGDAVLAVEMGQSPPAAPTPQSPVCAAGQSSTDLFFDDLESGAGNWVVQTDAGSNAWYWDYFYANSGIYHLWGDDQDTAADYSVEMASGVPIPAASAAYLRFAHAYGFEDGIVSAYDGGVLEYSTDDGASWSDAGSLATDNGYNGTIADAFGNPLGGRSAFVRESNGYISSRYDLASLAGQSVLFRFRIGTDGTGGDYGWEVDDVRIYLCATPTTLSITAPSKVTAGARVRVSGTLSSADVTCVASQMVSLKKGTATLAPKATGASGAFSFKTRITKKTVVRATFVGTATCGASLSAKKTIRVA